MIIFPNAKINLGLNIISRRDDGFHNLETILYPVDVKDGLEIIESHELKFSSTGIKIPGNAEDNLCLRAWHLMATDLNLPKVHIHLHKQIPVGAGLGGGSADAAFCIRLLNEKFDLKLSQDQMENYARQLGSDCAFFIRNKAALATGKGDVFSEAQVSLDKYFLVLVMPPLHVSTADAYRNVKPSSERKFRLANLPDLKIEDWKDYLVNDFEESVFEIQPSIKKIKTRLYEEGAIYASMSGSGAAVYGIFENSVKLKDLERENLIHYGV